MKPISASVKIKQRFFVCFQDELVMDLLSFDKEFHLETGYFPHFPSRFTPEHQFSFFFIHPIIIIILLLLYFYTLVYRLLISKRNSLAFIIRHSLDAFRSESIKYHFCRVVEFKQVKLNKAVMLIVTFCLPILCANGLNYIHATVLFV